MGKFFIDLLNSIISGTGALLNGIISLLPTSPFQTISNSDVSPYLGYLNWILPINEILSIMQLWLVAVAVFYIAMIILRWIKLI